VELTGYDEEKKTMAIRVVCGKGTYIRALARDIGRALNSGAYLTSLRRTRVGDISESDCNEFNHFGEWLDSEIPNEVSAAALQRPAEAKPQITPKAAGNFME